MTYDGFAFPALEMRECDEHASRLANRMPDCCNAAERPDTVVNGGDGIRQVVSHADTSFACFIAGEAA